MLSQALSLLLLNALPEAVFAAGPISPSTSTAQYCDRRSFRAVVRAGTAASPWSARAAIASVTTVGLVSASASKRMRNVIHGF
ncbi:MAG: hypothetical protein AAB502_02255, partial [Chloroflexota bacterium]